jgi:hypothetical protein
MIRNFFLITIIGSIIGLGGAYAQTTAKTNQVPKANIKTLGNALDNAPDLREITTGKKLQEGINLIHSTPAGDKISVEVKNNKITNWIMTDKNGKNIEITHYQITESSGINKSMKKDRCWICKHVGDERECFEIHCPWN